MGARVGLRSLVGLVVAGLLVSGWGLPVLGVGGLVGSVGEGSWVSGVDEARVVEGEVVGPVGPDRGWDPEVYEPGEVVWPVGGSAVVDIPAGGGRVPVGQSVVSVEAPVGVPVAGEAGFAGGRGEVVGAEEAELEGVEVGSGVSGPVVTDPIPLEGNPTWP